MKTNFFKLLPIIGIMAITISSCAKKECCTGYELQSNGDWDSGYEFCEEDNEDWNQLRSTYNCDTDNGVSFKCDCD